MFPVDATTARPLTKNGVLDASDDPELVATWFSVDFPQARIGIAAGASGLVIADLDRKNSKDGFEAVEDAWLELPGSWGYPTPNGGQHIWYTAPKDVRLTGNADYRSLSGFDRRGGNSYVVLHTDELPDSREAFTPAPLWLLDEATAHSDAGFSGTITDWLDEFGVGEPNERMKAAIARIPEGDISHSDMVADQFNIIRLAAEGSEGGAIALAALRAAWLARDPAAHSTPQQDWDFKFDEALESGIAKYGSELDAIAALPSYLDCLNLVPSAIAEAHLFGAEKPKRAYFDAIKALVPLSLTTLQISAIMWMAPAVKTWSRDFGIDYLVEQIELARTKAVADAAPRENPSLVTDSAVSVTKASANGHLLTDAERELAASCPTFVDRYCAWVSSRTQHANMPYHRAAAITIWSLAFGMYGFMAEDEGTLGCNFFQVVLGPSGSGKTRMTKMRDTVLREVFLGDPGYDLGDDASTQGLHEVLLKRDDKAAYFNTDEADSALGQWLDAKYLVGFIGFMTKLFEGWVPVMIRRGQKDEDRKGALVSFNMDLVGTSDGVLELLTEKLFKTGFLARPVWWIGDPKLETDERFKVSRGSRRRAEAEFDASARGFAVEFNQIKRFLGSRVPMIEADRALDRLEAAKKAIHAQLENHPRWSILEPSVTRLGDSMRKYAVLSALGAGRHEVLVPDMLAAIAQTEEWVRNVVTVSEQIAASDFQRSCDEMERFVIQQGGTVSLTKLTHAFRKWEPRDFLARKESLTAQGRFRTDNTGMNIILNEG